MYLKRTENCKVAAKTIPRGGKATIERIAVKEILINCLCGMKCKAHGAQEPRHIQKYVEVTSTAQRSNSPAQAINQGFLNAAYHRSSEYDALEGNYFRGRELKS